MKFVPVRSAKYISFGSRQSGFECVFIALNGMKLRTMVVEWRLECPYNWYTACQFSISVLPSSFFFCSFVGIAKYCIHIHTLDWFRLQVICNGQIEYRSPNGRFLSAKDIFIQNNRFSLSLSPSLPSVYQLVQPLQHSLISFALYKLSVSTWK